MNEQSPTFELSLGTGLNLLRLGDSFNQLLNDHTVTVPSITEGNRSDMRELQGKTTKIQSSSLFITLDSPLDDSCWQ